VPRFSAIAMRGIKVGPSPVWLQVDLARVGLRSINNIVDYTNFYMLLTGQPIHAYDYDKVKAFSGGDKAVLTVRYPRKGEKITLLNGKEIEPCAE
jgi:phenylalanyl-tRNA synthetase beta chain